MSSECPSRRNSTQKLSNHVTKPCNLTPLTRNIVTEVLRLRTWLRNVSCRFCAFSAAMSLPHLLLGRLSRPFRWPGPQLNVRDANRIYSTLAALRHWPGPRVPEIKCAEFARRLTSRKRAVGPARRFVPHVPHALASPAPANRANMFSPAPRSSVLIIATWNVNSVRQRLGHLLDYLKEASPDALCLQEIKCVDDAFPRLEVEALGYNIALHGQKGFNGVAILSKRPFEVATGLPGDPDDVQARYIEGVIPTKRGVVRVASIYLPNGNPTGTEKYTYKLAFMERLIRHARKLLTFEEPLVLAGDYNVIPDPRDAAHPEQWTNDALFLPATLGKFNELLALGFADALRATTDAGGLYSFWDYQAGAWQRNNGIRIDHLLLSPQAADILNSVAIDKAMRARDKASDHVPVRIELRD